MGRRKTSRDVVEREPVGRFVLDGYCELYPGPGLADGEGGAVTPRFPQPLEPEAVRFQDRAHNTRRGVWEFGSWGDVVRALGVLVDRYSARIGELELRRWRLVG